MQIFVSALEHSADQYLAELVAALKRLRSEVHISGLAGPAAVQAGCASIADWTGQAAMLAHAVLRVPEALALLARLDRTISHRPPDVAVLLDSPTFHLPLARRLKSRRIPVLYYIAPQVWAWAGFRVHKLRARTDRVACILPFERAFFRHHGVQAEFVGHPLMDRLSRSVPDPDRLRYVDTLGKPLISLLPGTRKQVIRALLPDMLYCVRAIRARWPKAGIAIAAARPDVASLIHRICASHQADLPVLHGWNTELLSRADLALTASGTATLEVAYHRTPMLVMYKASRLMYWLVARWLIHTKYLSLVNILADEELVPEYMPFYASPKPIAQAALDLLADQTRTTRMSARMDEIIASLSIPGVAERVGRMALDLAAESPIPASRPLPTVSSCGD